MQAQLDLVGIESDAQPHVEITLSTGLRVAWDTAFWGQRYAIVHDPDGNPIDLFAANDNQPSRAIS
jgi:uncharacterized glyoxalase superfamily protein PhnB